VSEGDLGELSLVFRAGDDDECEVADAPPPVVPLRLFVVDQEKVPEGEEYVQVLLSVFNGDVSVVLRIVREGHRNSEGAETDDRANLGTVIPTVPPGLDLGSEPVFGLAGGAQHSLMLCGHTTYRFLIGYL
jgi:hypothetical protein